jgi:hypothetical protein
MKRNLDGMRKAYYRRIPVYFNPDTTELEGRNWFYSILANIMIYIDAYIIRNEEGFPIWIEMNDSEKQWKDIIEKGY